MINKLSYFRLMEELENNKLFISNSYELEIYMGGRQIFADFADVNVFNKKAVIISALIKNV